MDVAIRRQQRVELPGADGELTRDLQRRLRLITAVVEPRVGRVELGAAINSDEAPGEMVVHRRRRTRGHDEGEETQLSTFIAVQRVLSDAAAHAAAGQYALYRDE